MVNQQWRLGHAFNALGMAAAWLCLDRCNRLFPTNFPSNRKSSDSTTEATLDKKNISPWLAVTPAAVGDGRVASLPRDKQAIAESAK
jgi:hypothetical protein